MVNQFHIAAKAQQKKLGCDFHIPISKELV